MNQVLITFLDALLIRNNDKLEFKVYRAPTCENAHKSFHSHFNTNTKRGIIIGFYRRSLRICSSKYLDEEFNYMVNSFLNLLYPKFFYTIFKSPQNPQKNMISNLHQYTFYNKTSP